MGIRFVVPETITLPLSDGDAIQVKKRLSHGERDAMFKLARESGNLRSAELVAYVVGWSSATPYTLAMSERERLDIINGLDPDSFDEIQDALKAHLEAQAQEKKRRNGASASEPTSDLRPALVGATSG